MDKGKGLVQSFSSSRWKARYGNGSYVRQYMPINLMINSSRSGSKTDSSYGQYPTRLNDNFLFDEEVIFVPPLAVRTPNEHPGIVLNDENKYKEVEVSSLPLKMVRIGRVYHGCNFGHGGVCEFHYGGPLFRVHGQTFDDSMILMHTCGILVA